MYPLFFFASPAFVLLYLIIQIKYITSYLAFFNLYLFKPIAGKRSNNAVTTLLLWCNNTWLIPLTSLSLVLCKYQFSGTRGSNEFSVAYFSKNCLLLLGACQIELHFLALSKLISGKRSVSAFAILPP